MVECDNCHNDKAIYETPGGMTLCNDCAFMLRLEPNESNKVKRIR